MFAPAKALDACRAFFIQQGVNIDVLRFDSTIAAFFDFYRDERAEGCAVDEDGGDEHGEKGGLVSENRHEYPLSFAGSWCRSRRSLERWGNCRFCNVITVRIQIT